MKPQKNNSDLIMIVAIIAFMIIFQFSSILAIIFLFIAFFYVSKNKKFSTYYRNKLQEITKEAEANSNENNITLKSSENYSPTLPIKNETDSGQDILLDEPTIKQITTVGKLRLKRRKKYLHIALNNSLDEAEEIINSLPASDRILIEVGTPLIKTYGTEAISRIKQMSPAGTYIVADNKCADLALREVEIMAKAGANAATCLGVAPIETINSFIDACEKNNIDSMLDMMNVENSLIVLKKLKKIPNVVILHRGVDETESTSGKQIPYYQIKQIKGSYNALVAVAGGDTIKEIQSAIFNDADIVVVWKNFYQVNSDTADLAKTFLEQVK